MLRLLTWISCTLVALLLVGPIAAQPYQLAPRAASGHIVPPWFEGWYRNRDGSATYSFGYLNLNTRDTLEIPLGPDNYIEPARFDGMQPTSFPPGRNAGVFAITVPADHQGDVVWHLRSQGQLNKVPGRATSPAYELGYQPMAMGSVPPLVRFDRAGPAGRGPEGIVGPRLEARVGTPLPLTVWAVDESIRERESNVGITWYKHQGPGAVTFTDASREVDEEGRATAAASFSAPGEYIVRIRADNFRAPDSTQADQCCWTNGYLRVNVTL
jgi:hypothetical protein